MIIQGSFQPSAPTLAERLVSRKYQVLKFFFMDCYLDAVGPMNELGLKPSKELPEPERSVSILIKLQDLILPETQVNKPEMGRPK